MRVKLSAVLAGVGLFMAAAPVLAHHSPAAEFDDNKPVTLRGTISKMEWTNPHTWLYVDVKQPDGTVVTWAAEGGAPNTLIRRGATKDSIRPGMEVIVKGSAARDGSHRINGRTVESTDGRSVFVFQSGPGAPKDPDAPKGP